jgi:hypothetical protein
MSMLRNLYIIEIKIYIKADSVKIKLKRNNLYKESVNKIKFKEIVLGCLFGYLL